MFAQRGVKLQSGLVFPMEMVPSPDELGGAGATVFNSREPHVAGNGAFYVSGEIPRETPYGTGLPGHMRRSADGAGWEPDPLVMQGAVRLLGVLARRPRDCGTLNIYVLYPQRKHHPARMRVFVDALIERFGDVPTADPF
jgi:DNA-binding transcriptional LysR family regulator